MTPPIYGPAGVHLLAPVANGEAYWRKSSLHMDADHVVPIRFLKVSDRGLPIDSGVEHENV
jgi:hypothetical protein